MRYCQYVAITRWKKHSRRSAVIVFKQPAQPLAVGDLGQLHFFHFCTLAESSLAVSFEFRGTD